VVVVERVAIVEMVIVTAAADADQLAAKNVLVRSSSRRSLVFVA
jgi:hypothetical protein